jgi:hypothetical protein
MTRTKHIHRYSCSSLNRSHSTFDNVSVFVIFIFTFILRIIISGRFARSDTGIEIGLVSMNVVVVVDVS